MPPAVFSAACAQVGRRIGAYEGTGGAQLVGLCVSSRTAHGCTNLLDACDPYAINPGVSRCGCHADPDGARPTVGVEHAHTLVQSSLLDSQFVQGLGLGGVRLIEARGSDLKATGRYQKCQFLNYQQI